MGIALKEVEYVLPGELGVRKRCRAEDVFSAFEEDEDAIPAHAEIRLAKFSVMFSDSKKPRLFTIPPSNYVLYARDDDAVPLGNWLLRQDFILKNGEPSHDNSFALELS